MDHIISRWLLSPEASIHLAIFALYLVALYILQFYLAPPHYEVSRRDRRIRYVLRAVNWGVFAAIFFLRGFNLMGPTTGVARLAILFLMLPEIAYQTVLLVPLITKRATWMQPTD